MCDIEVSMFGHPMVHFWDQIGTCLVLTFQFLHQNFMYHINTLTLESSCPYIVAKC
jgi:hypothetical protein